MTTGAAILFTKTLGDEPREPIWPSRTRLVAFDEQRHPAPCHRLLALAYAQGQGEVPFFEAWWKRLRSDSEYAAACMFVAVDDDDRAIAVAQCWTSAFLKDFAVAAEWRRRGFGTALLGHVFEALRRDGFDTLSLKVRVDNNPAIAFYETMGMTPVR